MVRREAPPELLDGRPISHRQTAVAAPIRTSSGSREQEFRNINEVFFADGESPESTFECVYCAYTNPNHKSVHAHSIRAHKVPNQGATVVEESPAAAARKASRRDPRTQALFKLRTTVRQLEREIDALDALYLAEFEDAERYRRMMSALEKKDR